MFSAQNSQVSNNVNYIEDVFSTYLYTGNGSTQTITNGIDLAGKGGLVWIKNRGANANHTLYDTVRGVNKVLYSDLTAAQDTTTASLTAFNSNGFSVDATGGYVNSNTFPFASWTFRKQPKFFDIQTLNYTSGQAVFNHNLESVPGMVILKVSNGYSDNWHVYHTSLGNNQSVYLNTSDAAFGSSPRWSATSTQFTVVTTGLFGPSTIVAYLFAHNAGGFGLTGTDNVISCGTFTTDGTGAAGNITLGYEAQWILFKRSDGVGSWQIIDTMRGSSLTSYNYIQPNTSSGESSSTSTQGVYPTATGFYVGNNFPGANQTYVYVAIRRGPMKVPTLGTSVYNAIARTGTGAAANVTGVGFTPDSAWTQKRVGALTLGNCIMDRLRGGTVNLSMTNGNAEGGIGTSEFGALQEGISVGTDSENNRVAYDYINWFMRRAPGFFDEVCYTGTGVANRNIAHNLGAVPELFIVKARTANAAGLGMVYSKTGGADKFLRLFEATTSNLPFTTNTNPWANTAPTSTQFTVDGSGGYLYTNSSSDAYVCWLFATCPGVSKVGSYTGTGALQTVACGFTSGARFVLIKRTDSTGDWYVWDSTRGISSGTDPYLLLNSTAAEVTTNNYVDTDSTGFKVTAAAPAELNASGGTYIFLAIA